MSTNQAMSAKKRKGNVLCFMLDTTQSMQNWIAAARTVLAEVVDLSTMTQAFDAVGVMEYGDYDSMWCAQAHVPNKYGTASDKVPIRFSGWGVIGQEVVAKQVVVSDTARVDINDVHDFASHLLARGGGRVPEAVKTALIELGLIASATLNSTCRVHLVHLTDAPMHLDMKGLDSEGIKEKTALGGTVDDRSASSPFSAVSVFSSLLKTFALSEAELAPFREEVVRGLAGSDNNGSFLVPPSRLHYTCVCNAPLVAGPFALLAHLTGGNVVSPRNVEIGSLRGTLQEILNTWMGIKPKSAGSYLKGNVCHLMYKTKPAVVYNANHCPTPAVAIPLDVPDDKVYEFCKCRRHDVVATGREYQSVCEPYLVVQTGLKRSLQRCLTRLRQPAEGTKGNRQAMQLYEKRMDELVSVLARVCTHPMALCSSPPLGKIWRGFTKRRGDPRRDEVLATVERAKKLLSPEDLATFNAWNNSTYDNSDDIQKELRLFAETNGVQGLVYFDGADEGFISKSLNNAFITCDRESQALIMSILTRMRVDRNVSVPSVAEAEAAKRAANGAEGMNDPIGSGGPIISGSESYFIDAEDGDEDLVELSDDEEGDEAAPGLGALPFPANALPLNLPLPTLFRLIMSIVVPGSELSRRPSAIVAALALRSGSVLRVPASLYLQSICGQWLTWKTMEGATKGSKVPLVPENFVGAFMRTLLSANTTLTKAQEKGLAAQKEGGAPTSDASPPKGSGGGGGAGITASSISHAANSRGFHNDPIFTRAEHMSLNKLLRLSTMLRVDGWQVTAEMIDVESTDGSAADYTLDCLLCKKARPWSIIGDDGICGYCKDSRTPEGHHAYGKQMMPNPNYRPPAPQDLKAKHKKSTSKTISHVQAEPKLIPVRAAPPAASAESTFQVRCSGCHGYYSRDKSAVVVGGHRCHYCRERSVEKTKVKATTTATDTKSAPDAEPHDGNDNDQDPKHIHRCNQCKNGFIGAPNRPLPDGVCAGCAAGLEPRRPTTTDRPTRVVKLYPFRLYWRDMAHGVGLREADDWPVNAVPSQTSLPTAAQAFAMPYVSNNNDDEDVAAPIITMPPNRWAQEYQRTRLSPAVGTASSAATAIPRSARHLDDKPFGPLPSVANAQQLWEHIVTSIYGQRFGGDVPMCVLCCEEFESYDKVHSVCGRKGCDQQICYPCGKEWYGGNAIGNIVIPRKCFCPCCARVPAPKILGLHNPDASSCGLPRLVQAFDIDHFNIGWCARCTKVGEHSAKTCEGARPEDVTDFQCEACVLAIAFAKAVDAVWRHVCPQCKTPTIRISGCHHISCPCGCHWCYECGGDFTTNGDVYGHPCPGRPNHADISDYESEEDHY